MIIGILQADSVMPQFQPRHGDYPKMFVDLLCHVDPTLSFRHYNVEEQEYPSELSECDGYVITGSRRSVYEDEPWIRKLGQFVVTLHEQEIPTVGICFGHQLIALFLGGDTRAAKCGWGVGVHTSQVIQQAPFMSPPLDEMALVVSHKDQVLEPPPSSMLLATSDFCPFSMYQYGTLLGLQGHPEFSTDYSQDLMNFRREILGEDTFDEGVASLKKPLDTDIVGQWIVNFIREHRNPDSKTAESDS